MNARPVSALLLALAAILVVVRRQPALAVAQGSLDAMSIGSPSETTARTPPARGQVFDPEALEYTKTFCVDMTHMESSQAAEVKGFLAKEDQPKKLLGRLPWQLIDDCTKADAVARIYFMNVHEEVIKVGSGARLTSFRRGTQPVLLLYDKASIRLFYRAEGNALGGKAVNVLGGPFSMLIKDLKKIDRTEIKGS